MQTELRRKAGQSVEEGQEGLEEDQWRLEEDQGKLEEGAGRRKELGALGSGKAVGWQQQRNPGVSGCVFLGAQKGAKWERLAGPQIGLSLEDGGQREGGPLPG